VTRREANKGQGSGDFDLTCLSPHTAGVICPIGIRSMKDDMYEWQGTVTDGSRGSPFLRPQDLCRMVRTRTSTGDRRFVPSVPKGSVGAATSCLRTATSANDPVSVPDTASNSSRATRWPSAFVVMSPFTRALITYKLGRPHTSFPSQADTAEHASSESCNT